MPFIASGIASVIGTLISVSPVQQSETCAIRHTAEGTLKESIHEDGFSFKGYDALCKRLKQEGLTLAIVSDSGVLAERSYGWVNVRLRRTSSGISGWFSRVCTILSREASTPAAKKAEYDALNSVAEQIARDPAPFIASVVEAETDARNAPRPS